MTTPSCRSTSGSWGYIRLFHDSGVAKAKYWDEGSAEPDWQVQISASVNIGASPVFWIAPWSSNYDLGYEEGQVSHEEWTVDWIDFGTRYGEAGGLVIDGWNTETLVVADNLFTTTSKVTPYTMSVSDQDGRYLYPGTGWRYDDNTAYNFWVKDGVTSVIVRYLTLSPFLNVNRPTPRSPRSGGSRHRPI